MPFDRFQYIPARIAFPTLSPESDETLFALGLGCVVTHQDKLSAATGAFLAALGVPREPTGDLDVTHLSPFPPEDHIDLTDPLGWAFAMIALYKLALGVDEVPESCTLNLEPTSLISRDITRDGYGWDIYTGDSPAVSFRPPGHTDTGEDVTFEVLGLPYTLDKDPVGSAPTGTPALRREVLCRCFAAVLKIDVDATWPVEPPNAV